MPHDPRFGVIVNLNRIYGGTTPSSVNMDEYFKKLQNQLPPAELLKDSSIYIIGSSPAWFVVQIAVFLEPFVKEIWIHGKEGPVKINSLSSHGFSIK